MPIEFSCPECTTLIRTPDATAGKKGKCPSCAAIVRIPGGAAPTAPATATPAKSPLKPTTPPAQSAPEPAETGPLEFFCSVCGQIVRTPRSAAGKKGKCPHCNGVIQIPLKSRSVKSSPTATNRPPSAQPTASAPTPTKPKPQIPAAKPPQPKVEDVELAPLDDLAPLTDVAASAVLTPIAEPKKPQRPPDDAFRAPKPIHQPKNPNIPPSEAFLQPMPDPFAELPPLANDPFASGLGGAPDPFGATAGGGVSLPAASPFAPAGGVPGSVPGGPPGVRKPIAPIMVILPAILQLLAIIPFLLLNMFVMSSMVYAFIVVGAGGGLLSADSMTKLVLYSMGLLFVFAIQIWAIFGSISMLQFRNYDNAIASAYISLVPCFGFCAFPFGIWSLIVLNDRGVKKMFTNS